MKSANSYNNNGSVSLLISMLIAITFSFHVYPQNQNNVKVIADKYKIQQWEKVNIKATLDQNNANVDYTFFINNERIQGINTSELKDYEFLELGNYLVKINARFNTGDDVGNFILTDSITINVRKVDLVVDPQSVFTGDVVTFRLGYKLPENNVRYRFHFGDNTRSEWKSDTKTTHEYEHNGRYNVYAEIGRFDGTTPYETIKSESKRVEVRIKPSYKVSLTASSYVTVDEKIKFVATPIINVPNQDLRIQIDFGDGTKEMIRANEQIERSYSYKTTGIYYAHAKMFNSEEEMLATSETLKINVNEIVISEEDISLKVTPPEVVTNEEVKFEIEFPQQYVNIRYRFYYGNGIEPSPWLSRAISTYKYENPGNYTVHAEIGRFGVNSINSLVESKTKQVVVNPTYRVYLSGAHSIQVDQANRFIANVSTNAVNQNFKYHFDFGDNTKSEFQIENNIEHSYRKAGTYRARVELTTNEGLLLAESNVINVKVQELIIPPESLSFIVTPMEVNADEAVILRLQLSNQYQNLKYRFYYGEDLQPSPWLEVSESSYKYNRPGLYAVFAAIGRFDGDSIYALINSKTKYVKVNPFIEVNLSAETSAGVDEEITFKAEAITNIENPDFRYIFDFGDSYNTEPQKENTTTHSYNKTGKYDVTVKLLDSQGIVLNSHILRIQIEENNQLLIILIILSSLAAGTIIIKHLINPKISITSQTDIGRQAVSNVRDTLIGLTIRINKNLKDSKSYLITVNKKLVNNSRRDK